MRRFLVTSLTLMTAAAPVLAANSLSVNASAALDGAFGLEVIADGTASDAYVSSEHPTAEGTYTVRFKIDPADYTMATTDGANFVRIGRAIETGSGQHILLFLQRVAPSGNFRLLSWVRWNDGVFRFGTGVFLTSGATPTPTEVEVTWVAGSPGSITMTNITGGQTASRNDITNSDWVVDTFHWGIFTGPGNPNFGFTGSYDLDTFSSFR